MLINEIHSLLELIGNNFLFVRGIPFLIQKFPRKFIDALFRILYRFNSSKVKKHVILEDTLCS